MANDDLRSAAVALAIMAAFNSVFLFLRLAGTPIFQPQFEFLLFNLPLMILAAYCVYLWLSGSRKAQSGQ